MKHKVFLIVFLALSLVIHAQEADEFSIPDQYIIQLKGGIDGAKFFASYPDMMIMKCLSKNMNIWLIRSDTKDLLSILKANPSVKVAQYNHHGITRRASLIPNDSFFNMQWNMLNTAHPGADISATEAWQLNHSNLTQMGDTIVIAVIDGGRGSGFDIYHPDINFFINHHEIPNDSIDNDGNGYIDDYLGWNVFGNMGRGNDSVYNASYTHPTHVSGIAAAKGNNTIGVAGVSWGVKVLAVNGASDVESDVIIAYDYVRAMRRLYDQTAGAKGAFIVATNSSFGIDMGQPANFPIWCAMYDSLGAYGILSATATANQAWNVDQVGDMPTTCPSHWLIAVTNTTRTDALYSQAAYGPVNIDLGAPGTGIISCFPDSSYGYDMGTSMATPHITGAVAALFANACPALLQAYFAHPDSIALLLRNYIFQSVDPLNSLHNITTTGGRLNLYHAMLAEEAYNCNNCNYAASLTQQNLTCYGDSTAAISVSAGSNSALYHYLWTSGDTTATLTGLPAGYYQVTITDTSGCQRQLSTLIYQPQPIVVSGITVIPIGTGSAGNIIINASAGHDSMSYAMDTGSYQSGAIFVTDSPGLHHIYIRNQTGCVYSTAIGIYHTGIAGNNDISFITLSPNPASGTSVLTIRSDEDMTAYLLLRDMTGRVVSIGNMQVRSGIQQKQIDVSMLSQGVYILTLSHGGEMLASMKVMVIN